MSSDASNSSFEIVEVNVQGERSAERSYYPSQLPVDSTDRVGSSQEHLSSTHSTHRPTECTSGSDVVANVELPKVEQLAKNLMIATRENERYRTAMEECNRTLSREVEAAEERKQDIENLMATLESYKSKVAELEDRNQLLQDQSSTRVCV